MDYILQVKQRMLQSLAQVVKVYLVYALIGALAFAAWTFLATSAISFT